MYATTEYPLGQSIISPPSYCPKCKARIPWKDNLPILELAYPERQAKCCGEPISSRYLFVEVSTLLLLVIFSGGIFRIAMIGRIMRWLLSWLGFACGHRH